MSAIKLIPINNENIDYKMIWSWCQEPFVYEWFEQRKLSESEIYNKYYNKINRANQKLFYINVDNRHIGIVQYYKSDYILDNYHNLFEYDLFIGEKSYLYKGYGQDIINLVNKLLLDKEKADGIILRPFKRNIAACKCYEKCNFKKISEYEGIDTLNNKETYVVYLLNML